MSQSHEMFAVAERVPATRRVRITFTALSAPRAGVHQGVHSSSPQIPLADWLASLGPPRCPVGEEGREASQRRVVGIVPPALRALLLPAPAGTAAGSVLFLRVS